VPQPYNFLDGVLLMELVADAQGDAAPRLNDVCFTAQEARDHHATLLTEVVRMLCAGVVHGDLSEFNILLAQDGPVIIDLPQAVDAAGNNHAKRMLLRDVANLRDFFGGLSEAYRLSFWLTLIPGLAAAAVFAILIREIRFTPKPGLRLGASLSAMPKTYRRFLVGVALFGIGDFSHLMLIGLAMTSTSNAPLLASWFGPDESNPMARLDTFVPIVPLLLYSWRNLIQALAAFPAGWLGDRIGHRRVLTIGYGLGTATMLGFLLVVLIEPLRESLPLWCLLFALAGIYMAVQETLEPAIVPELVPDRQVQGTAFGVLAAVNGYGDVVASLTVGLTVYWFGWTAALIYAAALMLTGTIWITATRPPSAPR
jgi:hypothetical protein